MLLRASSALVLCPASTVPVCAFSILDVKSRWFEKNEKELLMLTETVTQEIASLYIVVDKTIFLSINKPRVGKCDILISLPTIRAYII
ncbi:hypothetical protein O3G_MSEX013059 [Manduca sexta]|uniref:Secreted protein n=1 Tax=Manduca sexta TaxID=7130 RepID=A0A921ZR19_MANSE|nr:hypothetical protein O3G_MSEX013059 [Manduca sexta]KAG6462116.1 hypothetical protein O3G_MSEX013059 [Manduca sexta]